MEKINVSFDHSADDMLSAVVINGKPFTVDNGLISHDKAMGVLRKFTISEGDNGFVVGLDINDLAKKISLMNVPLDEMFHIAISCGVECSLHENGMSDIIVKVLKNRPLDRASKVFEDQYNGICSQFESPQREVLLFFFIGATMGARQRIKKGMKAEKKNRKEHIQRLTETVQQLLKKIDDLEGQQKTIDEANKIIGNPKDQG